MQVEIQSFTVNREQISVRLVTKDIEKEDLGRLHGMRNETLTLHIEGAKLAGKIASVNAAKATAMLIHMDRSGETIRVLAQLMDRDGALSLGVYSKEETELWKLMGRAAEMCGMSRGDLLYKITTFNGKNDQTVEGVRDPEKLSEKSRAVVISKLHKILNSPARKPEPGVPVSA